MPDTPLNPDAIRVATTAAHDAVDWQMYDVTKFDLEDSVDVATIAAVSAYLAVAQPEAIRELTEAIRLTVEYVGTGTLPAIPGWSWYDAMVKYAPNDAEVLRAMEPLPEASAAQPLVNSVEELNKLPVGSVFLDGTFGKWVFEKVDDSTYQTTGVMQDMTAEEISLPARVLYRPTEEPRDGRE